MRKERHVVFFCGLGAIIILILLIISYKKLFSLLYFFQITKADYDFSTILDSPENSIKRQTLKKLLKTKGGRENFVRFIFDHSLLSLSLMQEDESIKINDIEEGIFGFDYEKRIFNWDYIKTKEKVVYPPSNNTVIYRPLWSFSKNEIELLELKEIELNEYPMFKFNVFKDTEAIKKSGILKKKI